MGKTPTETYDALSHYLGYLSMTQKQKPVCGIKGERGRKLMPKKCTCPNWKLKPWPIVFFYFYGIILHWSNSECCLIHWSTRKVTRTNSEETAIAAGRKQLESSPWQCTGSFGAWHMDIFCKTSYNSHLTPLLLTRSAPCNFFLFPKMKEPLNGTHFEGIEDKKNFSQVLKAIPKEAHEKCFKFTHKFINIWSALVNRSTSKWKA